jgi:hypothetical protein
MAIIVIVIPELAVRKAWRSCVARHCSLIKDSLRWSMSAWYKRRALFCFFPHLKRKQGRQRTSHVYQQAAFPPAARIDLSLSSGGSIE